MFDDMFSSSKGAGVIGMLLAFFVFAAFILLGVAVFDGRFNGESAGKLAKEIRSQESEIEFLTGQTMELEQQLEEQRQLGRLRKERDGLLETLKGLAGTLQGLEEDVEGMEEDVAAVLEERNGYRERYRAAVRARAIGIEMEELKTLDGKVYKNIKIRKVTPTELMFVDATGPKGVHFKKLPVEMQDYYQFGEAEAAEEEKRKRLIQQQLDEQLQKVDSNEREKQEAWKEKEKDRARAASEAKIAKWAKQISDAEEQIKVESSIAYDARLKHSRALARGNISSHKVAAQKADERIAVLREGIRKARELIAKEQASLR